MRIRYLLVKSKDDFCQNIEQFKNLLSVNSRITIDEENIRVSQKDVRYKIEMHEIEEVREIVFQLTLEAEQGKEEDRVCALESVEGVLRRINEELGLFQINTIWDDVSMYYGRKLYPMMTEIESLLREIIYLFMIKNVGSKWLKEQSPKEVKDAIQKTLSKNQITASYPDTDALIYADFITLGYFFFSKYPLKSDYQRMIQDLKKKENYTEEKLNEIIEQYESKSNWERYFADKITIEGLSEKWGKLYEYRNKVAHTKKIVKRDYEEARKIIDELKPAFQKCLNHLDTADIAMTEAESEAIEDVAEKTIAPRIRYDHPDMKDDIIFFEKQLAKKERTERENNMLFNFDTLRNTQVHYPMLSKEDYWKALTGDKVVTNTKEYDLNRIKATLPIIMRHDKKEYIDINSLSWLGNINPNLDEGILSDKKYDQKISTEKINLKCKPEET